MSHRPPSLSPLFSELTRLEGIGNKTAQRLGAKAQRATALGVRVIDEAAWLALAAPL